MSVFRGGGGGGGDVAVAPGGTIYDPANLANIGQLVGGLTTLAEANAARKEAWFQNTSKTGYVWVSDKGDATVGGPGCTLLGPLQPYFSASKGKITAIKDTGSPDCLVTGQDAS